MHFRSSSAKLHTDARGSQTFQSVLSRLQVAPSSLDELQTSAMLSRLSTVGASAMGSKALSAVLAPATFCSVTRSNKLWKKLGCFKSSRPACAAIVGITLKGENEQKNAASRM